MMSEIIENLLINSKLPGKRANLELMWQFAKSTTKVETNLCLQYKDYDLNNTPEEFVMMCGIIGLCTINKTKPKIALNQIEEYANSSSWRVREAVAMGIQELIQIKTDEVLHILDDWSLKNDKYKRCLIAGLCEPKNLKNKNILDSAFNYLNKFTEEFSSYSNKLTEDQKILRKALAYAWSVAIVEDVEQGKSLFAKFVDYNNKNILWIVKNNLKKNRLKKMDEVWVENMLEIID